MPEIYFARHGQSTWNLERRVQGRSHEPPLTDLGREQAQQAAEVVRRLNPMRIVSSDQIRAAQTARVIAARCGLDVVFDERLREHDHGALTGLSSEEAIRQWEADSDGSFDPDQPQGCTGESTRDVAERFRSLWQELASYDGVVVLVSHGALIQIALAVIAKEDLAAMTWHTVDNGDVLDAHGTVVDRAEVRQPSGIYP